jgi:hypothetical protein
MDAFLFSPHAGHRDVSVTLILNRCLTAGVVYEVAMQGAVPKIAVPGQLRYIAGRRYSGEVVSCLHKSFLSSLSLSLFVLLPLRCSSV